MSATRRPQRPCKQYTRLMPVRATPDEAERIWALAGAARLSVSRYLVRLATEGRAPPTEEELEELRTLRFLLSKVSTNLNQIAHRTNRAWMIGGELPQASEIEGVVQSVKRLSEEIRKRLGKR